MTDSYLIKAVAFQMMHIGNIVGRKCCVGSSINIYKLTLGNIYHFIQKKNVYKSKVQVYNQLLGSEMLYQSSYLCSQYADRISPCQTTDTLINRSTCIIICQWPQPCQMLMKTHVPRTAWTRKFHLASQTL